jgi:hypothetical protein
MAAGDKFAIGLELQHSLMHLAYLARVRAELLGCDAGLETRRPEPVNEVG